ncbi:MAG: cysteine synthase A [Bacillota bacterium]|nr:cysteine synthase A [Bacillota bacterium]
MKINTKITELIGKTPLLEISGEGGRIAAKLEYFNPAGSIKDRAAYYMIKDAEEQGRLREGGAIIEPTSGNTGVGIAMIAAASGYRSIMVMPDSMSVERRKLLAAYGAELVLTPASGGMQASVAKAEELAGQIPGSIIAGQFDNPANPKAHIETTGPEIWEDTDGKVDILVATFGTGGTVTGIGRYLKEKNPNIQVVAVEPASSPLVTEGKAGPHKIQGIGANFIPENLDRNVVDEFVTVTDEDAFDTMRQLATEEGLLVGISSGAAVSAAREIAGREGNEDKLIIAVLPDTGERYLSIL